MDFNLSKEQLLIQQTAREFTDKFLAPLVDQIEEEHSIPMEVFQKAGEHGLLGIPFPEEVGGAGGGYDGYVLAVEQIGRVSSSLAMAIAAHTLGLACFDVFGTQAQRQAALPSGCSGELIASFAFTEPTTGSDPKQITATARRDGDWYILNGTKRFITNAAYPGYLGVVVKESETGQLATFMVDKRSAGYSTSKPWRKLAMHGGQLLDLYFEDYRVPAANLMGQIGDGYKQLLAGIGFGKLGMAAYSLGLAQGAYDDALAYCMSKLHRGTPILAKFQALQLMLADIYEKLTAIRLMLYKTATDANWAAKKNPAVFARECAATKDFVTGTAREIVNTALDMHGCYGLMEDYPIARRYREAVMFPQIEGPAHIQKVIVANSIIAAYQ
ncbi:MAG: acyl-CoA dehydrogenase family protein [Bifidobacteriaceae bacterium]|nr:acyl-CoA dehydrogenase family protein [Bifidobacteriaceae bacterium]